MFRLFYFLFHLFLICLKTFQLWFVLLHNRATSMAQACIVRPSFPSLSWVDWFIWRRFLTARVLWATDRAPSNEIKDKSAPDLNTRGFELENQWSEIECSIPRTSAPCFLPSVKFLLLPNHETDLRQILRKGTCPPISRHFFSSALCYCTAELLSSRGRPSSVVRRRPSVRRPSVRRHRFLGYHWMN